MIAQGSGISRYTYRYLDRTTPVYAVVRYSVPYASYQGERYNVVTAFEHREHADATRCDIMAASGAGAGATAEETGAHTRTCMRCDVIECALCDVAYMATRALSMPLVVVLGARCDVAARDVVYDIFYTSRPLD